MNTDDIIRDGLRRVADEAAPISDLQTSVIERGRRRRTARRVAATGGVVLSVGAVVGIGVVVANDTGSGGHQVQVGSQGPGTQQIITDPWWDTWTTDRYDGGASPAFLANARPTYDTKAGPEQIKVYAAGTTADGMQWAMFTDQSSPHLMQWLEGSGDQPNYGESSGKITPNLTWTSWTVPTRASQDGSADLQEWMIVVGQPGTTEIDYSPDGSGWQPLELHNGIAMKLITDGFPPASARVRLSDASGVYAEGTPAGAGAGQSPSPAPTAGDSSASPSPSPTSMTATASPAP